MVLSLLVTKQDGLVWQRHSSDRKRMKYYPMIQLSSYWWTQVYTHRLVCLLGVENILYLFENEYPHCEVKLFLFRNWAIAIKGTGQSASGQAAGRAVQVPEHMKMALKKDIVIPVSYVQTK